MDEILDVKPEDLDRIIDVNIKTVYYCYQEAARKFTSQGNGIAAAQIVAFWFFPTYAQVA